VTSDDRLSRSNRKGCLLSIVVMILMGGCCIFAIRHDAHTRNIVGPESTAIGALKTLNTSQTLFREGDKDEDGLLDHGTLRELSDTALVDILLGSGHKNGYVFTCQPSVATPELLWFATANPERPGATGERYFCTNHAGIIYWTTAQAIAPDAGGVECTIPAGLQPVGK
jgi:hypothetical protein